MISSAIRAWRLEMGELLLCLGMVDLVQGRSRVTAKEKTTSSHSDGLLRAPQSTEQRPQGCAFASVPSAWACYF
jgi:hypothetical protein